MTDLENIGVQASKGTRRQHPKKSVEVLNFVGQAQRVEIPSEWAFISSFNFLNKMNMVWSINDSAAETQQEPAVWGFQQRVNLYKAGFDKHQQSTTCYSKFLKVCKSQNKLLKSSFS